MLPLTTRYRGSPPTLGARTGGRPPDRTPQFKGQEKTKTQNMESALCPNSSWPATRGAVLRSRGLPPGQQPPPRSGCKLHACGMPGEPRKCRRRRVGGGDSKPARRLPHTKTRRKALQAGTAKCAPMISLKPPTSGTDTSRTRAQRVARGTPERSFITRCARRTRTREPETKEASDVSRPQCRPTASPQGEEPRRGGP